MQAARNAIVISPGVGLRRMVRPGLAASAVVVMIGSVAGGCTSDNPSHDSTEPAASDAVQNPAQAARRPTVGSNLRARTMPSGRSGSYEAGRLRFLDVAAATGLEHTYRNGAQG